MIRYTNEMNFTKKELSDLFLSVNWNSGNYPEKLYQSVKNSTYKIFAYDDEKLVGMVTALSDSCINLFITYILVAPEYQNKKIGSELLNKVISIKPFNRIELITEIKDKNFYTKHGFIEDGVGMFKINWKN